MAKIDQRLLDLGFTEVDVSGMEFGEFDKEFDRGRQAAEGTDTYVESTNVAAVRYARATDTLYVMFDNHREKAGPRLYSYRGVYLDNIHDDIINSGSPGSVVWERLRRPGVSFSRLGAG